jgi:hypothetical protein
VTYEVQDPATQWSAELGRLDARRRDAVVAALRHSAATGWPAGRAAVELLVAYAIGEITPRAYATGILQTLGIHDHTIDEPSAPAPSVRPVVSREDAVHAYVTGQIPVGEFLRLARG